MSLSTCLCGGKILFNPTIEKIIFLSSAIILIRLKLICKDKKNLLPLHPRFKKRHDDSLAQQVEHIPFKDGVLGSSPRWITGKSHNINIVGFFLFSELLPANRTILPFRYFSMPTFRKFVNAD